MAGKRLRALALLIICATMSAGCLQDLDDPSRSFSSIPQIILDHSEDTGETRVWMMSVLDHIRYENMSLTLDDGGLTAVVIGDDDAYSIHGDTNATSFTVTATASTENHDFYLVFSVEMVEDNDLLYRVTVEPPEDHPQEEPDEFEVASEDLPWKKTLTERPQPIV
jgi:hypothetical protein